jgi:hypothetical protein
VIARDCQKGRGSPEREQAGATVSDLAARLEGLRRMAERSRRDGDEDERGVAEEILRWIRAGEGSLEESLSLSRRTLYANRVRERDRLLRSAARRYLSGLPATHQADQLARQMLRYANSAWPRERALSICPVRHQGTIREPIWHALRLVDKCLSFERIRKVLVIDVHGDDQGAPLT